MSIAAGLFQGLGARATATALPLGLAQHPSESPLGPATPLAGLQLLLSSCPAESQVAELRCDCWGLANVWPQMPAVPAAIQSIEGRCIHNMDIMVLAILLSNVIPSDSPEAYELAVKTQEDLCCDAILCKSSLSSSWHTQVAHMPQGSQRACGLPGPICFRATRRPSFKANQPKPATALFDVVACSVL